MINLVRHTWTLLPYLAMAASTIVLAKGAEQTKMKTNGREYLAPDGGARVVVMPVGKKPHAESESRIEFLSEDGKIACSLEYSSEDGEHGFGIVKAEWTADSQYFVFSLTSSGGHQAWHAPTQFLSRRDKTIRSLDDYFEGGITKGDFDLLAPNTVRTEAQGVDGKVALASIRLFALPQLRSWRRSKPFVLKCIERRIFKPVGP